MKYSVAIPCHARFDLLKLTLNSLINQTYKDFQVVISDDSSNNDNIILFDVIKQYESKLNIKTVRTVEFLGQSKNTNQALNSCDGELIRILHSDDIISPTTISEEIELMDKFSKIECIINEIVPFKNDSKIDFNKNKIIKFIDPFHYFLRHSHSRTAIPSSLVFRKSLLNVIGTFDESLNFLCDWEFFNKILLYSIDNSKSLLFYDSHNIFWRIHDDSVSDKKWKDHYTEHYNMSELFKNSDIFKKLNFTEIEINKWLESAKIYRNDRLHRDLLKS